MKIVYIHGLSSSGSSGTADRLRKYLPNDCIYSPDLPIDPFEALNMLQEMVDRENIDLVIGTSMGGMFAQKLRGYNKIMVNPSFHVSQSMRQKIGQNEFFSTRADGATHYDITTDLCNRYESIERNQFEDITDHERAISMGLFGTEDDVVNCLAEYKQHYTRFGTFVGGHRLSEETVKTILIDEIEKFRELL